MIWLRSAESASAEQSAPIATGSLRRAIASGEEKQDSFYREFSVFTEVLEHIPDYRGALAEIERVLKPGGLFCASVPRRWPEKICWALSEGYYNTPGGHIRIFRAKELRGDIESRGFRRYHRHWAHALHAPFWWLKCLFWDKQDSNWLVHQYHRLLVWDLMEQPALTRVTEKLMNPVMGKSVVMYFRKGVTS